MKKILKIISINFLIFVFFIFLLEFVFFVIRQKDEYCALKQSLSSSSQNYSVFEFIRDRNFLEIIKTYYFFSDDNIINYPFRKAEEPSNSKKGSIVVFGCSYAYGAYLPDDETFSHLLSKLTGRNVYNFAIQGGCQSEALYLLKEQKEFLKQKIKNIKDVEYVIYIQFDSHEIRPFLNTFYKRPFYKKVKRGETIKLEKPMFNIRMYTLDYFIDRMTNKLWLRDNSFSNFIKHSFFDLFFLYILEMNEESKTFFNQENPPKFIFASYYGEDTAQSLMKRLEKEGVYTVDFNSLCGEQSLKQQKYFLSPTDTHPNKAAWELITPRFVEKFNL